MRTRRATTVTALTTASLLAGAMMLAGCGGADGDGESSTSAADSASGGSAARAPTADGSAKYASGEAEDAGGSGTGTSARVVPITRAVVYHGDITVRVKDVAAAVARAEGFVTGVDGLVYAEETSSEPGRKAASHATMTLKVPPNQFRPLLNQLGGLGKQLSRAQTAEDVTSEAVDVESRLRSQRSSVARLQALLAKATTVGAIVQVEGELSRRETDLEALEAQQKRLNELVDLATINVSFVAPHVKAAPVEKEDLGFLAGLRGGLTALLVVVVVTLTAAGAALPFVITLALVGVPAWWIVRSRRHPATAAPAPAPAGLDG